MIEPVARAIGLPCGDVRAVVELLEGGATGSVIACYRKQKTGDLDEAQIRPIRDAYAERTELEARRKSILAMIE